MKEVELCNKQRYEDFSARSIRLWQDIHWRRSNGREMWRLPRILQKKSLKKINQCKWSFWKGSWLMTFYLKIVITENINQFYYLPPHRPSHVGLLSKSELVKILLMQLVALGLTVKLLILSLSTKLNGIRFMLLNELVIVFY